MEGIRTPINILHLEDDENDSQFVQIWLDKEGFDYNYIFVDNESDFHRALTSQNVDIILSDYHLPVYSGLDALEYVKNTCSNIPFIFVSGAMGEEVAIDSMLEGATDYVLKNRLARLGPAVKRALKEAKLLVEYNKASESLKKSEAQYRTLVEGMNEGLMQKDNNDTIIFVNQQACDITGFERHELIGSKCAELLFSPENGQVILEKNKQRRQGIKDSYEIEMIRKNGVKVWLRCNGSPVFNEAGNVVGVVSVFENIDEKKMADEERNEITQLLINAKEKAEESDRLKSSFLANISHEIRTPMNGILGFAELLKVPQLSPGLQEHYVDVIEQSGARMLNIINNIVDISMIEAGQMHIIFNEGNINQILRELCDEFISEYSRSEIVLSVSPGLPDEKCVMWTDYSKLQQILKSLLKNSFKFTKEGTIDFGYKLIEGDDSNSNRLRFYVKDTGVGIPHEQTDLIFERFRQGNLSLSRAYEGAGLGLSIAKAFVEMLEGKIWVESELGKGSVFYFEIPFHQSVTQEMRKKHYSSVMKKKKPCALIVENDENCFLFLKAILDLEGIAVLGAKTGIEAVELVKKHAEIEAVLIDLNIPEVNEFETIRQIKQLKPELQVIAQSDCMFTEKTDYDAFITKPIRRSILMEILDKIGLRR